MKEQQETDLVERIAFHDDQQAFNPTWLL